MNTLSESDPELRIISNRPSTIMGLARRLDNTLQDEWLKEADRIKRHKGNVSLDEFNKWINVVFKIERIKKEFLNLEPVHRSNKESSFKNPQRNQQNQRANNFRNNYQERSWENSRPPAHQYNQNRPTAPFQQKMSDGRAVNNVRFADDNHSHQRSNNQRYHNPQQTHDDSATHVAEIHHDNNWQPEQNETAHVVRQVSVGSETRPKYISRKEKKEKLAELGKTRRFGRSARNQYRETQCWACCGQTWRICKENCQCECHLSDHLLRTEVDRELGIEVENLYPYVNPIT